MTNWHIITCEYPPQVGGVSDYTRLLAHHLEAAGDPVQVWAPTMDAPKEHGVHRVLGNFEASYLRQVEGLFDAFPQTRTLLLQWVPHGFGKRGMNLGFVRWITSRVRRGDRLYLMVHEPYLEPGQPTWKLRILSLAQRRMMRTLLASASRVFISIPGWETYLRPCGAPNQTSEWLPIPATIAADKDPDQVAEVKERFPATLLLGHLGTYSAESRRILQPALVTTMQEIPEVHALLLGSGSEKFGAGLKTQVPELGQRIHGVGLLSDCELAHHISACDLMVQPYIDGISSRRTSAMNVISRGVPLVSNLGHLSESLWAESEAVALAPSPDPVPIAAACIRLLCGESKRRQFANKAAALYQSRFDWPHIVARLRSLPGQAASTTSNQSPTEAKLK